MTDEAVQIAADQLAAAARSLLFHSDGTPLGIHGEEMLRMSLKNYDRWRYALVNPSEATREESA